MSLTSQQKFSWCILQPTGDWATRHSLDESYLSTEMQSVYCTTPAHWATKHLLGGVLPLCKYAVSIFCNPSRLGHKTLVEWVILLCRDAVILLCRDAYWATEHSLEESCPSAEIQSVYSTAHWGLGHTTLVGWVLPLSRDAVSVLYNPRKHLLGGVLPLYRYV